MMWYKLELKCQILRAGCFVRAFLEQAEGCAYSSLKENHFWHPEFRKHFTPFKYILCKFIFVSNRDKVIKGTENPGPN